MNKFQNLLYNIVSTDNNTVLYTGKCVKRVNLMISILTTIKSQKICYGYFNNFYNYSDDKSKYR